MQLNTEFENLIQSRIIKKKKTLNFCAEKYYLIYYTQYTKTNFGHQIALKMRGPENVQPKTTITVV